MTTRPLEDTIAETGPGIADDAVAGGQLRPEDIGGPEADLQAEALRDKGWIGGRPDEEAEAHPS